MTIKEQLAKAIEDNMLFSVGELEGVEPTAINCESIVEDVAVKFSEWITDNAYNNHGKKELFQLFKKENNI